MPLDVKDFLGKRRGPTVKAVRDLQRELDELAIQGRIDDMTALVEEFEREWGPNAVPLAGVVPPKPAPAEKPAVTAPVMGLDWPRTHGDGLQFVNGSYVCKRCAAESSDRGIMDEEGCCPVGFDMPAARPAAERGPRVAVTTPGGWELVRMDGAAEAMIVDRTDDARVSGPIAGRVWMGFDSPGHVQMVFVPGTGLRERTTFEVTRRASDIAAAVFLDDELVVYAWEGHCACSAGDTVSIEWSDSGLLP